MLSDSLYSGEYFDKELRKRKKKIIELEEKLEDERNEYQKLIFKKAGWEWRLMRLIDDSTKINVEL